MKKLKSFRIDKANEDFINRLAIAKKKTHPLSSTLPNFSEMLNVIIDEYRQQHEKKGGKK